MTEFIREQVGGQLLIKLVLYLLMSLFNVNVYLLLCSQNILVLITSSESWGPDIPIEPSRASKLCQKMSLFVSQLFNCSSNLGTIPKKLSARIQVSKPSVLLCLVCQQRQRLFEGFLLRIVSISSFSQ